MTIEFEDHPLSGAYAAILAHGLDGAGEALRILVNEAINIALAEMYVQGVSTRKVITVLQSLLGSEVSISSTQVSRAAQTLDTGLHA